MYKDDVMTPIRPKHDMWANWFSKMNGVPRITFATPFELWKNATAEDTLSQWMSMAPETLQRVEFWSESLHVQFSQNLHMGRIWRRGGLNDQDVQTAFVKGSNGVWKLNVDGEIMASGPDVEILTCTCGIYVWM